MVEKMSRSRNMGYGSSLVFMLGYFQGGLNNEYWNSYHE